MKPAQKPEFSLEKLYLDCIDESGNCFIIYQARLRMGILNLNYSGLIFSDSAGILQNKSSLKKLPNQEIYLSINLKNPALRISGIWKRKDEPVSCMLFSDELNNELHWNCHHPKATAEIIYRGRIFRGFGYAETIKMGVKPWNLPISELRWGRFLSENYSVIWIIWKGEKKVNKLYFNGVEYDDVICEDGRLIFGNDIFRVNFGDTTIIRKGRLSALLNKMPWLKIIFNRKILNVSEIKYKAVSTLTRNMEVISSGWSLYEVVKWENQEN